MSLKVYCDKCDSELGRQASVEIVTGGHRRLFDICLGCLPDVEKAVGARDHAL